MRLVNIYLRNAKRVQKENEIFDKMLERLHERGPAGNAMSAKIVSNNAG